MWRVCDCIWREGGGGRGWGGGRGGDGSFSGEVGDCDVAGCLEEALERLVRVAAKDEDDDDGVNELAKVTPAPTPTPTTSPTVHPTVAPTSSPTLSPTVAPSFSPTSSPTLVPTPSPTSLILPCLQEEKLLASDGAAEDVFGASVSISGDTALVSAHRDADKGSSSGSAYIFVRSVGEWVQQAKLIASDGSFSDIFGYSVSLSGNTALVGAPQDNDDGPDSGSAYVFVRDVASWSQQAKLTAEDAAAADTFGHSVSVCGDTAIVGAPSDGDDGPSSGSAYIFVRDDDEWSQQTKLTALDAEQSDLFGSSVSVSGDTALVGAYGHDNVGLFSGSAYVFTRHDGEWSQQAKLTPSDIEDYDFFGRSVSLSGDKATITSYQDDDRGPNSGSAYVFVRNSGEWTQLAKVTASDGAASDYFGQSASISGDTVVVGADWDDDKGDRSGSAYVYSCESDI